MGMCSSTGSCSKKRIPVRKRTSSGGTIVENRNCMVVPPSEVQEVVEKKVDVVTIGSEMHAYFKQQLEKDIIRLW